MSERAIELLCLPSKYLETSDSNDDNDDDDDNDDGAATMKISSNNGSSGNDDDDDGHVLNPDFTPQLVLDIGCGSGISGEVLKDMGHHWIGVDISRSMLDVACARHAEGDMFEQDMGQGLSFRIGVFDAVISISALQWLCNADRREHVPQKRLARFFSTMYRSVKRGGRCVFQFYPENAKQTEMITRAAMKAGFSGGVVVDYPNSTRARKCVFLSMVQVCACVCLLTYDPYHAGISSVCSLGSQIARSRCRKPERTTWMHRRSSSSRQRSSGETSFLI